MADEKEKKKKAKTNVFEIIKAMENQPSKTKKIYFTNYVMFELDGQEYFEGKDVRTMCEELHACSDGWPKRYGTLPFIDVKGQIRYIKRESQIVGMLSALGFQGDFRSNGGKTFRTVSKKEFLDELEGFGTEYDSINDLPHEPLIATAYYTKQALEIKAAPTGKFEELVDLFLPLTPKDKFLIAAFLATPFWGGPKGSRPAFVIEGPENDHMDGRGVGKSILVEVAAKLSGGYLDVPSNVKDIEELKKIVINNEGKQRLLRMDNVKRKSLSSEGLEGLITSTDITGRRLYGGADSRGNYFTVVMTFNEASMSKDLATRCVRIRLARPTEEQMDGWHEKIRRLTGENRHGVIADILEFLKSESLCESKTKFRFPEWVNEVLLKFTDTTILSHLTETVDSLDNESDLIHEISQCIFHRMGGYVYHDTPIDIETTPIRIPSSLLNQWVEKDVGSFLGSKKLKRLIDKGLIEGLSYAAYNRSAYYWWTPNKDQEFHEYRILTTDANQRYLNLKTHRRRHGGTEG